MKKSIFFPIFLSLLMSGLELCSQTYITPFVSASNFEVSNNDTHSLGYPEFANNREYAFGIGVTVDHYMSQRFSIMLNFDYERLGVIGSGRLLDGESRNSFYSSWGITPKFSHNRYSLGLGYKVFNNIQVSYLFRLVRTPTIFFFEDVVIGNIGYQDKNQPSDLLEYVHRFELGYEIKRFVLIGYFSYGIDSLSNKNLTNLNHLANSARIDPGKSFGIKIGYRFQVFEKIRRQNKPKVDCPKF